MEEIMQSIIRALVYLISAIIFFYGIAEAAGHIKSGEEISWGLLIIVLGFGVGPPLVLYFNPDLFSFDSNGSESSSEDKDEGKVDDDCI